MREEIGPAENVDFSEGWVKSQKILVILAHPDDPEFFCGGMISRWCELGHQVHYCLLTCGQRGSQEEHATPVEIGRIRIKEQRDAGDTLGVKEITYLEYMDGELFPDLNLRNSVIRQIRKQKPDIVVTSDPRSYFTSPGRINHPDHRAAGMAVFESVFPAAGNPCYKVRDEVERDLPPHQISELWLTLTQQWDTKVDLTSYFGLRKQALLKHQSQIRETIESFNERLESRLVKEEISGELKYYEYFCRIKLI